MKLSLPGRKTASGLVFLGLFFKHIRTVCLPKKDITQSFVTVIALTIVAYILPY